MKKILFLLILCSTPSFSQSLEKYSLNGLVNNIDNQAIEYGVALLYSNLGTTLIKSAEIENGSFSFGQTDAGNYIIEITAFGFEPLSANVALYTDTSLQLVLTPSDTVLDEVVITTENKMFTNKNGNIKVDVAHSVLKAMPNPLDLLAKLPGVMVSADKENISIVSRGEALIYIDNQRVTLADLNALSVDDIKEVEVIKNPSAKYEANGRAVLLITRKRSRKDGFEIAGTETASFKRAYNNYLSVATSFKDGKNEYKANLGYNALRPWEGAESSTAIPVHNVQSDYTIVSHTQRPQFVMGSGMHRQIDDNDYISFNINARLQDDKHQNITQTYYSEGDNESNVATFSNNNDRRNFVNSFLNYNRKIKSLDANLFTGLQYSAFSQGLQAEIENNYDNTGYLPIQRRNQEFNVHAITGRGDVEKTFSDIVKAEAGVLYLSASANTNFSINDISTGAVTASIYDFKEKNTAGYAQVSGEYRKLSYAAGLRMEITDIQGKYHDEAVPAVNKHYSNLFPKATVEYAIDSTCSVNLVYAKSIARPDYSSTSQVTVYTNPYILYSRNLNLNPTITDDISVGFKYADKSLSVRYYTSKDPAYFGMTYNETAGVTNFTTVNYAKESGYSVEAVVPFTKGKWSATNVLNAVKNKVEDPAAILKKSAPYLYAYSANTFTIASDTTIVVTAWGVTKRNEGVFTKNALATINFGVSKTLFKALDCTVSYNDIFRQMNFREDFTVNGIASNTNYITDSNEFSVSVKYKFGNFKDTSKQREVNESENRIQ